MGKRIDLHGIFKSLFPSSVTPHVYFQPTEDVQMVYPCIVYKVSDLPSDYADNLHYRLQTQYEVTVIDKDPESVLRDRVRILPQCRFNRAFTSDNLHHYVYTLYY